MHITGRVVLSVIMALVGSRAHAISRVGTCGLSDTVEGFSIAMAPPAFRDIHSISNSGVKLSGLGSIGLSGTGSLNPMRQILIYPLRFMYPELIGLFDRKQFKLFLLARGARWQEQGSANPNILVMSTVNGTTRTTLAAWGFGRGIVIISEVDVATDASVRELVRSIELRPGMRSW
ncbi:MAG: hypothetical protein AB7G93_17310 [Bdellovibrionales bacterium]